ncbi:MAG TPA: MFS transporter [Anaerolineales bacterium]|nr:MFS transporter [Anaerolineales bacterium]
MTTLPASPPTGYIQLVRENADFRNLWLGQIVSLAGDWFNLIASSALIAQLTGSGVAVGLLVVVRMLAQFVTGPIGGMLADRYNRKTLLIATDLLRGVVVFGFLLVDGVEDVWLLYALTAVQLGLSGVFNPTKDAILPDVARPEELGAANALNATTWSTMLAVGAALGGLVAGEWGLRPAFIIDALSFFYSAVLIRRVRYNFTIVPRVPMTAAAVFREYFAGFGYLRRHADILLIATQKAAQALAVSAGFQIIQVELASKVFVYGDGGSTGLGWMYAVVGLGTGAGPLLARALTGDRPRELRRAIGWSYLVTAAGLLVAAPLASFAIVLFGTFLRGFGVAVAWVFSTTLLLQKLPNEVRGKVIGAEYALFTLMSALGAPVAGWVLDHTANGVPRLLYGMTGLVVVFGLVWAVWGIRRNHE